MKKQYFSLVFIFLVLGFSKQASAQMVGTTCFLQGAWLEIGICANDAFGASGTPPTYHPHQCCGSPVATPGAPLAEVYDYGHDGWTIGTPAFMGDYSYPGSPFEGWAIQMNGMRSQQYASPAYTGTPYAYSGACTMTPLGMTYSNAGGVIKSDWSANFNAGGATLAIKQETRVDTYASAVVVTTKLYNTSAVAANNVYVWRSTDPDNDETWPGGAFNTNNMVNYQNDVIHRVEVTGTGTSSTLPPLSLGTKDCRCVAVIYNAWGLTVTQDLAAVWNQTYGTAYYNVGVNHPGDIGIGLVCNIGNIAPGDSDVVSYGYMFNGPNGLDSVGAFPEPSCQIAHGVIVHPPAPYPGVVLDTYNACANPGVTVVPVDLPYADEKSWTWSHWTWTPSLGLSSTTGTHVLVTTTALPPIYTYTVTGVDSATCQFRTMLVTFITCNTVVSNQPCYGDTLYLKHIGDSTGATYYWYGPGGFTSTVHNPVIFPATYADSGEYFVIRTVGGISDTDSITVPVYFKPNITLTNNSPLCAGMADTLELYGNPTVPGMTWSWTGPNGFTSSVQNPTRLVNPSVADFVGTYTAIVTTDHGCKDTATTYADTITRPFPPHITNPPYCQGQPFTPWTITGLNPGGVVIWYATLTSTTPIPAPTVPTMVPGLYKWYYSQRVGSCESARDSVSVRVTTTPAAPVVMGTMQYCQYIGPYVPLTVVTTTSGVQRWYTVATGGTYSLVQPTPNINVVPPGGVYHYWVSQIDSGCESPRTPVNITIHPKPAPPVVTNEWYCQFVNPHPIHAVVNGIDPPETLQYYGPGVTPVLMSPPTPNTSVGPDTIFYYVTETTSFGCVSDSSKLTITIRYKPDPPVTKDTRYCQHYHPALPLNTLVDSAYNADSLRWYKNTVRIDSTPVPPTDVAPGFYVWHASQWVNGCGSDSMPVKVEIVYLPQFEIEASSPWVCQHDSIRLAYKGPALVDPLYKWTTSPGTKLVNSSNDFDSLIYLRFDSVHQNHYIRLWTANDSGFCYDSAKVRIKVVPLPTMQAYTKHEVCLGDTVNLSLVSRADNAEDYTWFIDGISLNTSTALNLVSANSNSGGPFRISWIDSGLHVIEVKSTTIEGCKSAPTFDSVNVHTAPDPTFTYAFQSPSGKLCLEDSVLFTARTYNYNYSYMWMPEDFFHNENTPDAWGRLRQEKSVITLKVTDPYGCYATSSRELDPESCCTLLFPNAFAPNSANEANKVFRPYYAGYHKFHQFRIVNRWGQTVFESGNTTSAVWDGKFNGVPQDMGVYYYFVKFDCGGKTIEQKGDVTLVH